MVHRTFRAKAVRELFGFSNSTLYEQMSPSQLVPLDEALRAAWAHVEDWYGQKVPIKNLKVGESRDLILLGLMCSHRSGFVRADAIGALGKAESEKAIPFLMIRLIDWVEKVRLDADVELIKKIKPRFASSFVRYLGLLRRLTLHSRFRPGYRRQTPDPHRRASGRGDARQGELDHGLG